MENPFKNIIDNQKAPEILRKKVMDDIRLIKLTLDLADLVAIKYPTSIIDIIDTTNPNNNNNNNQSENI